MTDQQANATPPRAVRLVVQYEGEKLSVIDRQDVEMAVPPSDALRGFEEESGFWIELRDAKNNVLYRRVHEDPIRSEVEAFEEDGSATRAIVDKPSGVFTVLVPDIPEADHVAVVSSPRDPEQRMARPAKLMTRLPLRRKG
jgi:hypothetical protein